MVSQRRSAVFGVITTLLTSQTAVDSLAPVKGQQMKLWPVTIYIYSYNTKNPNESIYVFRWERSFTPSIGLKTLEEPKKNKKTDPIPHPSHPHPPQTCVTAASLSLDLCCWREMLSQLTQIHSSQMRFLKQFYCLPGQHAEITRVCLIFIVDDVPICVVHLDALPIKRQR